MALPSIATIFDFDIPQTNVVITEEETHASGSFVVYEKTIPKPLNVHEFLDFQNPESSLKKAVFLFDDKAHLSPFLSIFAPPPEA